MATGLDHITSFSAVAACMNNLGPGLGDVGAHYGNINETAKWILCFAMLLGRLEIFTLLVLFSPEFWRTNIPQTWAKIIHASSNRRKRSNMIQARRHHHQHQYGK